MHKKYLYLLFFFLNYSVLCAYAEDNRPQRQLFLQARQLLLNKNYQQFAKLEPSVKNYLLYPYLIYIKLRQRLAYQSEADINHFLDTYSQTPVANKLRKEYLMYLAKQKNWSQFIRYYQPIYGTTLQCYHLNALITTNQKVIAYQAIPALWVTLNSPPEVCQEVFSNWEKTGRLSRELIWKKLEQAIQSNDFTLIQHLAEFLSAKERQQVKHWCRVCHDPSLVDQSEQFNLDDKIDRKILLHGIHRFASQDPDKLSKTWPLLTKIYHFSESETQGVLSALAIALARHADFSAKNWLRQVKSAYTNTVLREWRVRNALLNGNWQQVLYWIDHLSIREQQMLCWRYWRARALAETQQISAANTIYKALAKEVDYYAVLASQRLKQQYQPLTYSLNGDQIGLQKNPAIQRAKELYALDLLVEARGEWQWALDSLSKSQLQAAAQLAKKWQWYDLAIIAATKAQVHHDIKLRFPTVYRSLVLSAARTSHVNSAWILAIMRQESAFVWDAKSSAGALGLMQIMPQTGRMLAEQLHLGSIDLLEEEINIRLGSAYLSHLLKTFDGNVTVATAAYNVGPTRIRQYRSLFQRLPRDVWVEILPWQETRDYIKSVSLARSIYLRST